jgi:very-short-patch-repair endonuclease
VLDNGLNEREFNSLLDYYIACLKKEEAQSLVFDIRSEGKTFFPGIFTKEAFMHGKSEQVTLKKDEKLAWLFREYELVERKDSLFYGYPLHINPNGKVTPLFFMELFFEQKDGTVIFTKGSVNPEFNHYLLAEQGFSAEEIMGITEEINEKQGFQAKLKTVLPLLEAEESNISPIISTEKIKATAKPRLTNQAILYYSKRTGITKGLIAELETLRKMSHSEMLTTSLRHIIKPNTLSGETENQGFALEIFPLNDSQENAVKNSLSKPLTVITGPPGTGKSQVVLNIIANAVWNNQTILFASKNNKAVDVVIEKLKSTLTENLVVRMGASQQRRAAKREIEKIFQKKESLKLIGGFEERKTELGRITSRINQIKQQLNSMSLLNESIENLREEAAKLEITLPERLRELCRDNSCNNVDKFELEEDLGKLTTKKNLFYVLLEKIFSQYFRNKNYKTFRKHYDRLPPTIKEYFEKNISLNEKEIIKAMGWILTITRLSRLTKEIKFKKAELLQNPSVYRLQEEEGGLHKKRVELSRKLLEAAWLRKIKATKPPDENHVSRYLDATEKTERYIQDYELWKELTSVRETEMRAIQRFLPIWSVTNLSAKNSLPLKENLFDILVIDEASQCDIASALPLMYRAKQTVIIGDPQQLKHISLLHENQDKKIAVKNNITELFVDFSYSQNSLYELNERILKSQNMQPILLDTHYRSDKNIIEFSNEYFYMKRLNIQTDEKTLLPKKSRGIKWIDVKGKTVPAKSPYNEEEIDQLIRTLEEYSNSDLKGASFGVVTLFRAQMEKIISKIEKNTQLKSMNITVGTAHCFQGDEKDIMLFSPTVSQGVKQNTLNWINTTKQLINVAITRAKSVLIIIGDKQKCLETKGVLADLAAYTDKKKEGQVQFDSPIEKEFYDALVKNKIQAIPQYKTKVRGKTVYRLDFALFNKNKYDIEIDGDKAHQTKTEYDSLRDAHLRMEGWKIRRYKASQIQDNTPRIIEEIKRLY